MAVLPYLHKYMDDRVYRSAPCPQYCQELIDPRASQYLSLQAYDDHYRSSYFDRPFERSYDVRSHSPHHRDFDGYDADMRWYSDESIRRNNREAALANCFTRWCRHTQIHPMMTFDGRYPSSFKRPLLLPEFLHMGQHELDRIMMAYELGISRRRYYRGSLVDRFDDGDLFYSSSAQRRRDLIALFEFLGAYQLVEHLRMRW